jgi:riboflavin synthase
MFTGIIEKTAKVKKLLRSSKECSLTVENPFGNEIKTGDSIAVDGICLTVESFSQTEINFFVSAATVMKTVVSEYDGGTIVNLERAMKSGGRFDGHIVQGHIDTTGVMKNVQTIDKGVEIRIEFSKDFGTYIVDRGSVAVNGISLTWAVTGDDFFIVSVIPETVKRTSLKNILQKGKKVNLEFDVIGKYVSKIVSKSGRAANMKSLLEKL